MIAHQRREKILKLIQEDGYAKVQDLSKVFDVTEVTIRQDLEKLEIDGLIVKKHGGAYLSSLGENVKQLVLIENRQQNISEKKKIAKKALEYIKDGDTIILDAGSTTTELAKLIVGYKNLTVITNALNIALILGKNNDNSIKLIVTGGEFKASTLSLTGDKSSDFFQGIYADKLFFSAVGVSLKNGLTYPSISDISLKKSMMNVVDEIFLLVNSEKIGQKYFASLGKIGIADYIITDSKIEDKYKKEFKQNKINLIVAD